MENLRLQIDEPKFYRRAITELGNVEMFLQPIYNSTLQTCGKCYQLRSLMAQQCVPMLINFKETLEERTRSLHHNIQTLKALIQAMDDAIVVDGVQDN